MKSSYALRATFTDLLLSLIVDRFIFSAIFSSMNYEREHPSSPKANRILLARAAGLILRNVSVSSHSRRPGSDSDQPPLELQGDARIAEDLGIRDILYHDGYYMAFSAIERNSGLLSVIFASTMVDGKISLQSESLRLGSVVGFLGEGVLPHGGPTYVHAVAVVKNTRGVEKFVGVGILEDGRVFDDPRPLEYEPRVASPSQIRDRSDNFLYDIPSH